MLLVLGSLVRCNIVHGRCNSWYKGHIHTADTGVLIHLTQDKSLLLQITHRVYFSLGKSWRPVDTRAPVSTILIVDGIKFGKNTITSQCNQLHLCLMISDSVIIPANTQDPFQYWMINGQTDVCVWQMGITGD